MKKSQKRWKYLKKEVDIPVTMAHGYITKYRCEKVGSKKSHINDAICISKHPYTKPLDTYYLTKAVRHQNRQIHKANFSKGGIRKRNQAPYLVKEFRLFDKALYQGKECFVFARRISGRMNVRLLDGMHINASVGYKNLKFLELRKAYLIERRTC